MYMIFLIIAALAGLSMAVQGSFNGCLGKVIGLTEATLIVHIIGTVASALTFGIMWFTKAGLGNIGQWGEVPWYNYLGGLLSVAIVYGVAASVAKLGVSTATTAIVASQTLAALVLNIFGACGMEKMPFTWWKFLGIVFLAIGTKLMLTKS